MSAWRQSLPTAVAWSGKFWGHILGRLATKGGVLEAELVLDSSPEFKSVWYLLLYWKVLAITQVANVGSQRILEMDYLHFTDLKTNEELEALGSQINSNPLLKDPW